MTYHSFSHFTQVAYSVAFICCITCDRKQINQHSPSVQSIHSLHSVLICQNNAPRKFEPDKTNEAEMIRSNRFIICNICNTAFKQKKTLTSSTEWFFSQHPLIHTPGSIQKTGVILILLSFKALCIRGNNSYNSLSFLLFQEMKKVELFIKKRF